MKAFTLSLKSGSRSSTDVLFFAFVLAHSTQ